MKLGSIFASAAGSSGGNSTTRIAVPLSGGDNPMGLVALSSLNENPGGEESVIHRFAAGLPDRPGLSVRRPSNSAIALLLASRPVTTRRTSAAVALEHANRTAKIDQNVLCIIASSLVLPERRRRWAAHSGFAASAGQCRSRPSRLLQHAVLLAEMIAWEHVEIGAGDADHPGLFRMRGRMNHPGAVGFGLPRPEAIPAHRLENRMRLALGVGTAPFGHLGIFPRVAVDRPR